MSTRLKGSAQRRGSRCCQPKEPLSKHKQVFTSWFDAVMCKSVDLFSSCIVRLFPSAQGLDRNSAFVKSSRQLAHNSPCRLSFRLETELPLHRIFQLVAAGSNPHVSQPRWLLRTTDQQEDSDSAASFMLTTMTFSSIFEFVNPFDPLPIYSIFPYALAMLYALQYHVE